jgi:hypothetical protein
VMAESKPQATASWLLSLVLMLPIVH